MISRPRITYIYDALCGWCYGFSPVMDAFYNKYKSTASFTVLSGGLFLGERIGPINEVAAYIKEGAYKQVEETTGVTFGASFIEVLHEKKSMKMDSHYPAMAMVIVKELAPEKAMSFAHILLSAFYTDGIDPSEITAYIPYLERMGIKKSDFISRMEQTGYREKALQEFRYFQKLELGGFPSVIVTIKEEHFLLAKGYTHPDDLEARYQNVLSEVKQKEL